MADNHSGVEDVVLDDSTDKKIKEKATKETVKQLQQYRSKQIEVVLELLAEGNTIPFIARYRKEMTGALDEVMIKEISDTFGYLTNFIKRKEEITRLIDAQGKLTNELILAIEKAEKLTQLEDIYRPFKQKRRTKAMIAKEKGLEPLALRFLQDKQLVNVDDLLATYVDEAKELGAISDVLSGVHEIIAEMISDNSKYRDYIRTYTKKYGVLETSVKNVEKDEKQVYEMYYAYEEKIHQIKPHRVLAISRGEKEDVLKVNVVVAVDKIYAYFDNQLLKNVNQSVVDYIRNAYVDSYKRFIAPSIEREIRQELTGVADTQAIHIFAKNLENLLLQPPMKDKVVLGLDPAYRTGCKLAIVDSTGKVLDKGVIYPHKPASEEKRKQAKEILLNYLHRYQVEMIAIGNGTASRESELFVSEVIKSVQHTIHYVIVNEAGASVYSASDIARAEFPDYQVEERSAVSIARRLQDPLSELVKIDPKSVGVGQYQHDVAQKQLHDTLAFVVETVVNKVGVNLNTASSTLLQYVSGINKTIANNIVTYRNEHGMFNNRMALKNVPRLGPKAFEQAVGFLKIVNGENILDNTQIHPESYPLAKEILKELNVSMDSIGTNAVVEKLERFDVALFSRLRQYGEDTVKDIVLNLQKPGRDIRDAIETPLLRSDVLTMADLTVGMSLQGTVRNVVDFGAFVDIGVKQDGLVHLSKISKKFVKHASEVLSVGQIVTVYIEQVDMNKGRIALTMLKPNE